MSTVLVSGGFDPLHIGHLNLFEGASCYGEVVVAVNSDEWLLRKKGYLVMTWPERARIIRSLRQVWGVVSVPDTDGTVCKALRLVGPSHFANGGDRDGADPREHAVCQELGIVELFGIGGGKARSSSELVRAAR